MSVIRWCMPFGDGVHSARAMHGCTLARPTWHSMKKGAGVHGARAVHVQVFSTHHFLAALRGTRVAPPIPNSQVTRIPYQLKILLGCHLCGVPAPRARGGKPFSPGVLRFKEILS